jgi:hypothetical protein
VMGRGETGTKGFQSPTANIIVIIRSASPPYQCNVRAMRKIATKF